VRIVADGETVTLGGVAITAQFTPGHTPGGTSWSWKSCVGEHCLGLVYGDSLTPISAEGFRFTGPPGRALRASIAKLRALPCDLLITTHPSASDFWRRMERADRDPHACKAYADSAEKLLSARLKKERD
jgi:metallo-beta-lactamase class B